MELLLELLLIEFMFFIMLYGSLFFVELYCKAFPHPSDLDKNVTQNVISTTEEEIYDTGFLRDMESFDGRIDDLREVINQTKGASPFLRGDIEPSIEVITDDFERSMETK